MHVYALTFLPDGSRVAAGGMNARGYIFDLAGKADPVLFADHGDSIKRVAITPACAAAVLGENPGAPDCCPASDCCPAGECCLTAAK